MDVCCRMGSIIRYLLGACEVLTVKTGSCREYSDFDKFLLAGWIAAE